MKQITQTFLEGESPTLIGYCQESPGMPKVFLNNEQIFSSKMLEFRRFELYWILACSLTSMQAHSLIKLFELGMANFFWLLLFAKKSKNDPGKLMQWSSASICKKVKNTEWKRNLYDTDLLRGPLMLCFFLLVLQGQSIFISLNLKGWWLNVLK